MTEAVPAGRRTLARLVATALLTLACAPPVFAGEAPGSAVAASLKRPFADLKAVVTLTVGHTADWVAVTDDAVWVGSTGPNAVHRIDPATNRLVASVALPGEPCAGLVAGFGKVWVPLCAKRPVLARVDVASNSLQAVTSPGPAGREGGIAASADSLWLVIDKHGTLARLDPASGAVRQRVRLPAGAFNPIASAGIVWVSRAEGAALLGVDARSGALIATITTGPGPRFLAAGGGSVWTLNQGDGSLSQVSVGDRRERSRTALGTPGHGGDITFGAGIVWTTVAGAPLTATDATSGTVLRQWVGRGGDSLAFGHGALWLTDYHGGTIARIRPEDALAP